MCQQYLGAELVSIHDNITNYLLSHRTSGSSSNSAGFWIGLNSLSKRGYYKWTDNSEREFTNLANITLSGDPIPRNYLDQGNYLIFFSSFQ